MATLNIGDAVVLQTDAPRYGAGGVPEGSVGIIVDILKSAYHDGNDYLIRWTSIKYMRGPWKGVASDFAPKDKRVQIAPPRSKRA